MGFAGGQHRVEVHVGRDGDLGPADAGQVGQQCLQPGFDGRLVLAPLTELVVAFKVEAGVAGGGQDVAGVVGDRHLVGAEALHRCGHQVHDGVDLRLAEVGAAGYQQDGGRSLAAVVDQQIAFGDDQVHVGRRDAVDDRDGAGQLALQGPLESNVELGRGGGDALVFQDVPTVGAAGEAEGGHLDPQLMDLIGRHLDDAAATFQLVRNPTGVEFGRHRRRRLRLKVTHQHAHRGVACGVGHQEDAHERGEEGQPEGDPLGPGHPLDRSHDVLADGLEVDLGHQICIRIMSLKAVMARSRTATVISVAI